jgi:hypothetical protein
MLPIAFLIIIMVTTLVLGLPGTKRKSHAMPSSLGGQAGSSSSTGSADSASSTGSDDGADVAAPVSIASGVNDAYTKPLQSKQGTSSVTAIPTHPSGIDTLTALVERLDAIITFATSINANQPVATIFDRSRVYETLAGSKKRHQIIEIEGRAFPVSAYFHSYLQYLLNHNIVVPGFDKALANTTQQKAQYRLAGFLGTRTGVRIENVIKQQAFTGTGAASAYAENDGGAGADRGELEQYLADYWVARAYGSNISSLTIRSCYGFMLAAAADISSGFTIKAGSRAYVAEEISDIEDRINDLLGSATMSLTGAAAAAINAARGQPQDPFTGAGVFLFADIYKTPRDITIIITTPQAVQLAVLTDDGIEAIST